MAQYQLKRKHVVITGASDGIGRALALEVAGRGARVTLSARSRDKLAAATDAITTGGGVAVAIPADVSSEGECRVLMEQAIAAQGPIDVLVCNAGIGSAIQGDDPIPIETIRRTMDVNFMGAVHATAAALPSLQETRGLIVAVSSLQGLLGFPKSCAYAASKHAMQGFFDSLRIDLAGAVGVLVVSPGPVATNIHRLDPTPGKKVSDEVLARQAMPVADCARLIRRAIEARRRDLVMTSAGRLAVRLYPFFPGFVDTQVLKANRRFYGGGR